MSWGTSSGGPAEGGSWGRSPGVLLGGPGLGLLQGRTSSLASISQLQPVYLEVKTQGRGVVTNRRNWV